MRKNIVRFGLMAALSGAISLAAAETPGGPSPEAAKLLQRGKELLEAGKKREAYEVLHAAFLEAPGDVEINYQLGHAAYEAAMYEEAITAFERILETEGALRRVRLELARSYYGLGHYEMALRQFEKVLAAEGSGSPESRSMLEIEIARCRFKLGRRAEAQADFRRLLDATPPPSPEECGLIREYLDAALTPQTRNFFSGKLSVAATYDSNARVSPELSTVGTALGPVVLDEDARKEHDWYVSGLVTLDHVYVPAAGDFAWRTGLVGYSTRYDDEDEQDLNYFRAKSGPLLSVPLDPGEARAGTGAATLDLGLAPFLTLMDRDDRPYLKAWGVEATGAFPFDPEQKLLARASVTWERRKLYQNRDRDADHYGLALETRYRWGALDANRLFGTVAWEIEDAKAESESYRAWTLSLGYARQLPWEFELSCGYGVRLASYDERDDLFDDARDDEQHLLSAGLARKLPWWGLAAEATWQRTIAHSNVDLYEYRRSLVGFGLSKEF